MRLEVQKFAGEMERVLKENDHRGGWGKDKCSIKYLEYRLVEEVGEYFKLGAEEASTGEPNDRESKKELVDIANFCLMLHERLGEEE